MRGFDIVDVPDNCMLVTMYCVIGNTKIVGIQFETTTNKVAHKTMIKEVGAFHHALNGFLQNDKEFGASFVVVQNVFAV